MARIVMALALVLVTAHVARADDAEGRPRKPIDDYEKAVARGDFEEAKRILLDMYTLDPVPQLLFNLGQVELNLKHYEAAIRYYEKFLETNPPEDQAALAQQAIGAARIKLAQPEKQQPPPPPPALPHYPPRQWYLEDTGLVALGGLAAAVGGGLIIYSHKLGTDTSGSLSDFDDRLQLARTTKWTGIGVASAGALVIGVTVLRWRLRPDGGVITAQVSPSGVTVAGRW